MVSTIPPMIHLYASDQRVELNNLDKLILPIGIVHDKRLLSPEQLPHIFLSASSLFALLILDVLMSSFRDVVKNGEYWDVQAQLEPGHPPHWTTCIRLTDRLSSTLRSSNILLFQMYRPVPIFGH